MSLSRQEVSLYLDVWMTCLKLTFVLELPSEKFAEFYNIVNGKIAQLVVHTNDTNERIGGILALDRLIDFDSGDPAQQTTRFASYLRSVMRGTDNAAMILAARAIGKLAV